MVVLLGGGLSSAPKMALAKEPTPNGATSGVHQSGAVPSTVERSEAPVDSTAQRRPECERPSRWKLEVTMKPVPRLLAGSVAETTLHITVRASAAKEPSAKRLTANTTTLKVWVARFVESLALKGEGATKTGTGFDAELGTLHDGDQREYALRVRVKSPDSVGAVELYRAGLSYLDPENGCVMSSGASAKVQVSPAKPGL